MPIGQLALSKLVPGQLVFSTLSPRLPLCPLHPPSSRLVLVSQLFAPWCPVLLSQGILVLPLTLLKCLPSPFHYKLHQVRAQVCCIYLCVLAPSTESIPFPWVTLLTSSSVPGTSLVLYMHHFMYPSCIPMRWVKLSLPLYK